MATTETVASGHTSTTDEQIEKKENEEDIGHRTISLSNEDEDKHYKPEDVQGLATLSSETEGEAEGDEKKAEHAVADIQKSDDSPALDASAKDNQKHDWPEDVQVLATPLSKTEGEAKGDEKSSEHAVVEVEKSDDSPALEASAEDNLKHDKVDDEQGLATPLSKTEGEAEGDDKSDLAVVEVVKSDDSPAVEASAEDNLKPEKFDDAQSLAKTEGEAEENEKISEVVVIEVEKPDDSPALEASTEGNLKHDKVEDVHGLATPSSMTEQAEGDEKSSEHAIVEVEKSDDSPALEAFAENNLKHDTVDDAQGLATPLSKIEGGAEGNEKNSEEVVVEVEKPDDSPALEASTEDNLKRDRVKHAQGVATPSSKTEEAEGDDTKAEAAVVEVEKSDDSPALEASAENNPKHDKAEDAQGLAASLSRTEGEAEGDEKKVEPTVVFEEKTDDSSSLETSVADNLKEEKELIPDSQTISVNELEHDAAKSQPEELPSIEPTEKETSQQLENESTETVEEMQHQTADIPESSAETIDKSNDTTEAYPLKESETEVVKETEILETSFQNVEKPEPMVTELQEKSKELENESQEKAQEAEQPNTVAIPESSAEINEKPSDAIEEKSREPEFDVEVLLKESINYEAGPTVTEKAEPVVTENEENPSEQEKQSIQQEEEEKQKSVIPETATESAEKPGDIVEVEPPKESDIKVVKETVNSESEAVPGKVEKPELVFTNVEEKSREQLEVAEEVGEASKDVKTQQELVLETAKSEGTSDAIVKDPISLKEEKTDKGNESGITGNTTQVSLNEEAQAAPTTIVVDSSLGVAEKVVEEFGKKESSFTDVIEGVSKEEVVGVLKNPEQEASINQEVKTDVKEEREFSAPTPASVEEKVAANDDKKEPEVPDAVEGSSREAEVDIKKAEEQAEAKTATTKARGDEDDNKKEGQAETKVDEVAEAVREPVRETLASKFEEKEEEEPIKTGVDNFEKEQSEDAVKKTEAEIPAAITKESDATKTSKDKPAHKQSHNIISKVKQSLVKAKKALTGKSPSSKTLSSDAKGDTIKVK